MKVEELRIDEITPQTNLFLFGSIFIKLTHMDHGFCITGKRLP